MGQVKRSLSGIPAAKSAMTMDRGTIAKPTSEGLAEMPSAVPNQGQ